MSTSEPAIAEAGSRPLSWNERSIDLGPGLLRLADGSYRRPIEAAFHIRCTGPLAHWEVSIRFDLDDRPDGEERLLFLYPLPPQASIGEFRVLQKGEALGPDPRVRSLDELTESVQPPLPSPSMQSTFGTESLPILSLGLEPYLGAYHESEPLELRLVFGNGLPTEDGRIRLCVPGRVDESLASDGSTTLRVHIEIEDGNELVDDPICSDALQQRKVEEVLHLEGDSFGTMDRDLEVTFRPGRTEMPVTRLRRSGENFLFSIFPPTSIPASPQRRDLVFCVDASENVLNGLFDIIRDDLCSTLRKLDDHDRFALVTYGRDIDGYDGGEFCEVSQVEEACRWLHKVEPKGRADIQPLLARIQALPSQPDRQLCIFLLAAGHVGNEPAILKGLDFDQSDRRYYAVGIGPSVQQAFLRRLALLARGRCEVAPQGHCAEALARLLSQTRALLAEVTFEGQDGKEAEVEMDSLVPFRMSSLTPEGPVHCMGKGSPSSLRFRSKDETGVFFAGTVNARNTDNPALSGVWAGMRVREMLDSVRLSTGAKRKQLRAETSALASAHGILVEDTLLVVDSDNGPEVQLSVLPYRWKKGVQTVAKADEEATATAPAFDWRKGLKARDGLFNKGARPGEGEGSGEVRHGLRRPGELAGKPAKGGRDPGKPMLDRFAVSAAMPHSTDLDEDPDEDVGGAEFGSENVVEVEADESRAAPEESLDTPAVSEPSPTAQADAAAQPPTQVEIAPPAQVESAEPAAQVEAVASPAQETAVSPPAPATSIPLPVQTVAVPSASEPVFQYTRDPMAEAAVRMDSYIEQLGSVETRMAMASLAALPSDVARTGPDLPRILAQTVGHLEKRGYFSAAISVLGLLLRDYNSPEVTKKMESLLVGWATSLEDEHLPEAIHILQTGLRVCPGSETLAGAMEPLWSKWTELSAKQAELPMLAEWRSAVRQAPEAPLLSNVGLEMARLQQSQQSLAAEVAAEMAALRASVQEQLSGLPALLEEVLASRPVVVQAVAPPPVADLPAQAAAPMAGPVSVSPPVTSVATPEIVSPPIEETAPEAPAPDLASPIPPAPVPLQADAELDVELPLPDLALPAASTEQAPAEVNPEPPPAEELPPAEEPGLEEAALLEDLPLPPATPDAEAADQPEEHLEPPLPELPLPDVQPEGPSSEQPPAASPVSPESAPVEVEPAGAPPSVEVLPVEQAPVEVGATEPAEEPVELDLPLPVAPAGQESPAVLAASIEEPAEASVAELAEEPVPEPEPISAASVEEPEAEDSGESLNLTRDELLELLQAEPRDESSHRAVKVAMPDPKDRINFYRDLVRIDKDQIYHSLALARAYREADQTKVAVVHYQKYLRSEKDAPAQLELADAYDELGKSNLSVAARKAAELMMS